MDACFAGCWKETTAVPKAVGGGRGTSTARNHLPHPSISQSATASQPTKISLSLAPPISSSLLHDAILGSNLTYSPSNTRFDECLFDDHDDGGSRSDGKKGSCGFKLIGHFDLAGLQRLGFDSLIHFVS
ncbi:hypothetical protein Fcan01_02175 [Folsomia candida]|uniref:Uncharacterized protein n=1 Tax=Folsomia candida TaxID=158441 RepID=A0A226F5J6_FOLCA|nr:hypothetical protein Fcan01_02175 [Folsomia candida]